MNLVKLICLLIFCSLGLLSLSAKSEIVVPRICTAKFPAMYEAAVDAVKYFDEITARKERLKEQGIVRREFSCAGIGIHDEKSQLHGTPLF
ncbi:hypothetical protein ASG24_10430 [Methylophilus sp. Leaf414]|nr:hypothetical protein ASG24_10430 [Methylophilus sp. Leaf414]